MALMSEMIDDRILSGKKGQSFSSLTKSGLKFCARPALGEGSFRCFSVHVGAVSP